MKAGDKDEGAGSRRAQTSQRSEDRGMTSNRLRGGNQRGWMDETMNCKSIYVTMWTPARMNLDFTNTNAAFASICDL